MAGPRPHKRMIRTPVDVCLRRKTSSPKSLSAVISTLAKIRPSNQDDLIRDPRGHLGHVCDLMAIEAEASDNLTVDALIGEERHRGIDSRG